VASDLLDVTDLLEVPAQERDFVFRLELGRGDQLHEMREADAFQHAAIRVAHA
jgi:hypothetical protein